MNCVLVMIVSPNVSTFVSSFASVFPQETFLHNDIKEKPRGKATSTEVINAAVQFVVDLL